jgi:hypothetical protein
MAAFVRPACPGQGVRGPRSEVSSRRSRHGQTFIRNRSIRRRRSRRARRNSSAFGQRTAYCPQNSSQRVRSDKSSVDGAGRRSAGLAPRPTTSPPRPPVPSGLPPLPPPGPLGSQVPSRALLALDLRSPPNARPHGPLLGSRWLTVAGPPFGAGPGPGVAMRRP